MKPLLLLLVTLFSCSAFAQSPLVPNRSAFQKKWLRDQNFQMIWYMGTDSSKTAMATINTKHQIQQGKLSIITEVIMKNRPGTWADTTVANAKNLAPIRHSSYNMQRNMELNFGDITTGFYYNKATKKTIEIADTSGTEFFDSNLYPALLAWLPLAENYSTQIAIYDYNPSSRKGIMKARVLQVQSGEYNTQKEGLRPVWMVKVTDELNNAQGGESTYHFDKADRRLWQQTIIAGKRKMMMVRQE